jgi:hypothetical protein
MQRGNVWFGMPAYSGQAGVSIYAGQNDDSKAIALLRGESYAPSP